MTICLVLGGASCLWDDLARFSELSSHDLVVACNDAGAAYTGKLDAFCTLHPEKLGDWIGKRRALKLDEPKRVIAHQRQTANSDKGAAFVTQTHPFKWTNGTQHSGSSGLYCVKVAMEVLDADKIILCGVPMDDRAHYFDDAKWQAHVTYRQSWKDMKPALTNVRSMSGFTKQLLGAPTARWIEGK